ncbi:MAG: DUF362 domain-containing protein [Peptostreptococcaceae bacterium]|nr:DUF362 domain-containing protein [Peptostreptococcaceae bacterium]
MSKVVVVRCETYDREVVYEKVRVGLDFLGGLNVFFDSSEKILIKPNLLASSMPDKCVTTHPAVFEAVVRIMKEEGFNIKYGDSPGFGNPEKVAANSGLKEVADRYGLSFADFSGGETVDFPQGNFTKQFELTHAVEKSDGILNLCKMKAHQLTRITGAVKNSLGLVYGINKGAMHVKYPDAISFSKMLVDLNLLVKPRLHIMDGIIAMEGNGPRSGNPKQMNVIIMSDDPVAIDATFCRMVDLNPALIPTVSYGESYGLGKWKEEDIEYLGDDPKEFISKDFDIARGPVKAENIAIASIFRSLALRKPFINESDCIRCGVCVDACPVDGKALAFKDGDRSNPPVYDYKKCIRCYCCQEMCPEEAIDVKTPLLGKLFLYR